MLNWDAKLLSRISLLVYTSYSKMAVSGQRVYYRHAVLSTITRPRKRFTFSDDSGFVGLRASTEHTGFAAYPDGGSVAWLLGWAGKEQLRWAG